MFVSIEGVDKSGKSTILKKLLNYFKNQNLKVFLSREPGGEIVSEKIRAILLNKNLNVLPWSETLLYIASRYQHYFNVILPKLKKNYLVLCDRFLDSTLAYQCNGRNLDSNYILNLQTKVLKIKKPQITIVLNISYQEMKKRILSKNKNRLDIDMQNEVFFNKVANFYINLSKSETNRVYLIDANNNVEDVFKQCLNIINQKLNEQI